MLHSTSHTLRRLVDTWFARERALAGTALAALLLVPPLGLLAWLDERTIGGIGVWTKPIKFHLAIAVYLGTLAWYARWIAPERRRRLWYRLYTGTLVLCVVVELSWLSAAAALGEPSHFNRHHPVFAALYPLMGVLAVTLTTGTLVIAALVATEREHAPEPLLRTAVVGGLVASCLLTVVIAGQLSSMESHWIGGTRDDAVGLPVLGWSRDGGDLRVAHFFALHAMHFVPLLAVIVRPLILRPWRSPAGRPEAPRVAPSTAARAASPTRGRAGVVAAWLAGPRTAAMLITLAYTAFVVATYRQALNGQPFL